MYRFAFDLGSGSLGWAVLELDRRETPTKLIDMGVRIFPTGRDPKSKESNASGRRQPRLQRRQIDRRNKRRQRLGNKLVSAGLMPPKEKAPERAAFFAIDPYSARARAANGVCSLHELGRVIWHMSKHRGFKSNRQADRTNEEEGGKIAPAAAELRARLAQEGAPTYGAWLAKRHEEGKPVRVRSGNDKAYDFYPTRQMLEDEFDHIWRVQAQHHPELTADLRDEVRDTVFFQRPLKPVLLGRCTFFPEDYRLPKWHPLAQEFIILGQLNALRILGQTGERALDLTSRDLIAAHLINGEKLTWKGLLRLLNLPSDTEINLERGGLKELARNESAARLAGTKKKPGPLAELWAQWNEAKKLRLLEILDTAENPENAIDRLARECGLEREKAAQIERINLPDGHIMIGSRAASAIVQVMREQVTVYSEAIREASRRDLFGEGVVIHHSDMRPEGDPGLDRLPRYNELLALQRMIGTGTGNPEDPPDIRFGRIANPTVHVALGQFRRVMNALIDRYGKPAQVVIEATRDMAKSTRELNELERTIKQNTKRNDEWREELEKEGIVASGQRMGDRLLRMRLWEELGKTPADRLCPYSGRPIALHQLHSDEVEIDHILPFEDTFDDSPANKTVCFRSANRIKGKRAPGDAWTGEELAAIIDRVKSAHGTRQKLWRFLPGALEKWQEDRGFEDRQLHATGYLARVVRAYAEALFPKDGTSHIWMPVGRMTAMMRRRWGIHLPDHNAKTRDDHRHHGLDAAIIGVIDRRMIQQLQTYARRIGAENLERVLPAPPEPYPGYRDQVMERIRSVQASHRPDHSTSGRLHEDTAYGLIRDVPENQAARTIGNLVVRKPVIGLTAKELGQVRDEKIREALLEATEGVRGDARQLAEALAAWSKDTRHRRLRIIKPADYARPVYDPQGRPYKWLLPGEIAYMDILEGPDGRWFHHATDIWAANSEGATDWHKTHPDASFVMRLYKNDTIQLFDLDDDGNPIEGSNSIKRIQRLSPSNSVLYLVGVNDAGDYQKRHSDEDDPFRWDFANVGKLRARRARRVRVDELGRVRIVPHGRLSHGGRR